MMKRITRRTCLAGLAVVLAAACALPATAETLGDALREGGWDRVLGTWIDAETGGRALKMVYAWRFKDTLMELRSWENGRESVSFMGRNGKTGEVYHFGADEKGGGSLGQWNEENGEAVLGLRYVTHDGEEGGMRLRFRLEDDDTMVMTVEGEEETTIKLVRAGKREGPGQERKTDKTGAQRKREGVFFRDGLMVYVDTPMRLFDANQDLTIQEDELQKGYVEILKGFDEIRASLLQAFDEDKDGAIGEAEGNTIREFAFQIAGLLRDDRNGDWKVDEAEADQAWELLEGECDRRNEALLQKFDRDRDGVLDEDETTAARRAIRGRWGWGGR